MVMRRTGVRFFISHDLCFPANRAYFTLDAIRAYRQHGVSILLAPVGSPKIDKFCCGAKKFRDEVMIPVRAISCSA